MHMALNHRDCCARRLSVAGILRHPWFRTELSPTLISLNHDLLDLPTAVRPSF